MFRDPPALRSLGARLRDGAVQAAPARRGCITGTLSQASRHSVPQHAGHIDPVGTQNAVSFPPSPALPFSHIPQRPPCDLEASCPVSG